jgi:hypothetical protein
LTNKSHGRIFPVLKVIGDIITKKNYSSDPTDRANRFLNVASKQVDPGKDNFNKMKMETVGSGLTLLN